MLRVELSEIVKEAFGISCEEFTMLVDRASNSLHNEKGDLPFQASGRLVTIRPHGKALVIGDLHGDIESLCQILHGSEALKRLGNSDDTFLIFLGDYGDRGQHSIEVYYVVLKLKALFPHRVVLMRGNHEGPVDIPVSPHDLPSRLKARFGGQSTGVYSSIRTLFENLYNCVLVKERYLIVHGGPPQQAKNLEDLANAHLLHPKQTFLEEIIWSDPDERVEEAIPSPRGAGKLFGKKITYEAINKFNVQILIRGHEPCDEGFKINHDGKILTLFSRKGPPYFNSFAAYLDVNLSRRFEIADQLVPYIRKF